MTDPSVVPDFELPATGNQRFSVFGASRDSVKSHETFKRKMGFAFELLSDPVKAPGHAQEVLDYVRSARL
jgi:peroxiredoxin